MNPQIEIQNPLQKAWQGLLYALFPRVIVLDRFQYTHLQNRDTGQIRLVEGPARLRLSSREIDLGQRHKLIVNEGQYALIYNPYNPQKGDIETGEQEVRVGPLIFSLHPGEELADDLIRHEYILQSNQALLLRASQTAPHPQLSGQTLAAGAQFLLKGPGRYIPHKYIEVLETRQVFSLGEKEGLYIQDEVSGEVSLLQGPQDFFLEAHQSLWNKPLSSEESQALGYQAQDIKDNNIRTLASPAYPRKHAYQAVVLSLEDQEAVYLYEGDQVRVVFGPQTVFLGPHERPKVLFISGGVPLQSNRLRLAKLHLGPDFIRDQIVIRTHDSATLTLDVSYRWRFELDPQAPEKLFTLRDFIGFAAKSLSADIRGEAAQHDFERFHAEAHNLIRQVILGDSGQRRFEENGLVIFGVDVEALAPQEDQISSKLATAILSNVEVAIETHRALAELSRESELLVGQVENAKSRQALIELEAANQQRQALLEAETQAQLEQSRLESHRQKILAEIALEEQRLQALIRLLASEGGQAYIELERARALKATDKVIVPSDARLHLGGMGGLTE